MQSICYAEIKALTEGRKLLMKGMSSSLKEGGISAKVWTQREAEVLSIPAFYFQHELLSVYATQLLEKEHSGCHALLRDDKVEDLSRMYRLFSKIPRGLDPVSSIFKQHVTAEGTALVKQAEDAASNKKMETAINIAYACKLIDNDMKQFIISSETDEIREVESRGDQSELENLSFMYSNAQDYAKAKRRVAELYKKHEKELIEMEMFSYSTAGGAANQGALGPFGLLVLADESLSEQTPIYFYVAKGAEGKLKTFFCADESRCKPVYMYSMGGLADFCVVLAHVFLGNNKLAGKFKQQVIFETSRLATIVNGVLRKTTQDIKISYNC
ncbi:unnamed protein product [Camellia sinensis]